MREILFRAKRLDNGEWVKGYVTRIKHSDDKGKAESYYFNALDELGWVYEYAVSAKTICQYTGLTDKNGRKIWEDDIIRYEGKLFQIVWVHGCALFAAHPLKENRVSPCLNVGTMKNAEVVGNIFDNPELIGGKEE